MTRAKSTFLGILLTLLMALFLRTTLTGAAFAEQSSGWQIVPSPNPPHSANGFNGVAAIAANDVWASGSYNPVNANVPTLTIIVHWNGKAWTIVPSPNATRYLNYLEGMSAASANDIWVVGGYLDSTHPEKTLIEHWNGRGWAIIPSPNVGFYSNELEAVKALSATNVWAVGHDYVNNASQTLVEHWNGTTWSVVPSPNSGSGNNGLSGIAAISATNIWAVGYTTNSHGTGSTLSERWNGTKWNLLPSLNPGTYGNSFTKVVATSASDVWAFGNTSNCAGSQCPILMLIEHWNGTQWSVVSHPNPGAVNYFYNATALSAADIWLVGTYVNNTLPMKILAEHWNGTHWQLVATPNPGAHHNILLAISALSPHTIWAVGVYGNLFQEYKSLTLLYR